VRFHRLTVLHEKLRLSRPVRWQLAGTFSLGLLVGIGLASLVGDTTEAPSTGVMPKDTTQTESPRAPISDDASNTVLSPDASLRVIAAMVLEGRVAEAESKLRAFRQRYPNFEVTPRPSSLEPEFQHTSANPTGREGER
jgi:hypothetical protein